jgi:hypothetical protein
MKSSNDSSRTVASVDNEAKELLGIDCSHKEVIQYSSKLCNICYAKIYKYTTAKNAYEKKSK